MTDTTARAMTDEQKINRIGDALQEKTAVQAELDALYGVQVSHRNPDVSKIAARRAELYRQEEELDDEVRRLAHEVNASQGGGRPARRRSRTRGSIEPASRAKATQGLEDALRHVTGR